jgi:hypothetical protein
LLISGEDYGAFHGVCHLVHVWLPAQIPNASGQRLPSPFSVLMTDGVCLCPLLSYWQSFPLVSRKERKSVKLIGIIIARKLIKC